MHRGLPKAICLGVECVVVKERERGGGMLRDVGNVHHMGEVLG